MNALTNKVQLIGNLGTNPQVKELTSGKKLVRLSMATSKTYRSGAGEKVKKTQWHSLIVWGKTAAFAEKYLLKGQQVSVEGTLVNRNYTDKDGVKRSVSEVQVNEILIIKSNKN